MRLSPPVLPFKNTPLSFSSHWNIIMSTETNPDSLDGEYGVLVSQLEDIIDKYEKNSHIADIRHNADSDTGHHENYRTIIVRVKNTTDWLIAKLLPEYNPSSDISLTWGSVSLSKGEEEGETPEKEPDVMPSSS